MKDCGRSESPKLRIVSFESLVYGAVGAHVTLKSGFFLTVLTLVLSAALVTVFVLVIDSEKTALDG